MRRELSIGVALAAMVACAPARVTFVHSPAQYAEAAFQLHLRSGEVVTVERVVRKTQDALVVELDDDTTLQEGTHRAIRNEEIEAVDVREPGPGAAQGVWKGALVGGLGAVGLGASACVGSAGLACAVGIAFIAVAAPVSAVVGAVVGGVAGGGSGRAHIYRRALPSSRALSPGRPARTRPAVAEPGLGSP